MQNEAQQLVDLAANPDTDEETMVQAAQALFEAAADASPEAGRAALITLSSGFTNDDPQKSGFLAVVCGALVENGFSPEPLVGPILQQFRELIPPATRFMEACEERLPESEEEEEEEEETDEFVVVEEESEEEGDAPDLTGMSLDELTSLFQAPGEEDDEDEEIDEELAAVMEEVAVEMPDEANAWIGIEAFSRAAITVLSASPEARAVSRDLRASAEQFETFAPWGHWITLLLSVLDNEPIVVIEPAAKTGFVGTMSGISGNFQLQTLLMDVYPRAPGEEPRISQEVAENARGLGEQVLEETLHGSWNLYTYQALRSDHTLPEAEDFDSAPYWIWGEGKPEDIPTVDNHRVILLGPPTYERMWRVQREFDQLKADITITQLLTPEEVDTWLSRLVAANNEQV